MKNFYQETNYKPENSLCSSIQQPVRDDFIFIGLDAGGTKIEVTLINNKKEVLRSLKVLLPANPAKIGIKNTANNLITAITYTCESVLIPIEKVKAIFVGLAGIDDNNFKVEINNQLLADLLPLTNFAPKIKIITDSDLALLNATKGKEGLIIISGTGSIIKGRNKYGKIVTADGWGDLLGDEGSALSIGRKALTKMIHAHDGLEEECPNLTEFILAYLEISNLSELIPLFYSNREVSVTKIPEIAKIVYQVANIGDKAAQNILIETGERLASSAIAVIKRLELANELFPIALVGSVFEAREFIRNVILDKVNSYAKNSYFYEPEFTPSVCAAIKALEFTEENGLHQDTL